MIHLENSFAKYIESTKTVDIHPELVSTINSCPVSLCDFNNAIIYGPRGSGKYTQALRLINKYSDTGLRYNKKICIHLSKDENMMVSMSDIHFEIDMELLGCNSKSIFNSIYLQICDIVKTDKTIFATSGRSTTRGIILCKNFQCIQNELLQCFYTYMTMVSKTGVHFILHTESIGFIPSHILDISFVLRVSRPPRTLLNSVLKTNNKKQLTSASYKNISNLVDTFTGVPQICDYSIHINTFINNLGAENTIENIRTLIYDITTYNVDIVTFVYKLINEMYDQNLLIDSNYDEITKCLINFYMSYEKHYRVIFHLERLFIDLVLIHESN